ncbi:IS5 family transposase [Streptomyces sp. NPDC093591]|uniref:IS5 family transposase n=1 Tax=Streptomyces sp. NPDC093591 TaxID=3366044 RepID=UPI00380946BA
MTSSPPQRGRHTPPQIHGVHSSHKISTRCAELTWSYSIWSILRVAGHIQAVRMCLTCPDDPADLWVAGWRTDDADLARGPAPDADPGVSQGELWAVQKPGETHPDHVDNHVAAAAVVVADSRSVQAFFARRRGTGLVSELHERLHRAVRRAAGRALEPSAAVIDSQSVKADATVAYDSRGFDVGKKINGRKRHLLTDTLGLLLDVLVTPASTTDRDAARILLPAARSRLRGLSRIWADAGYRGHLQDWTAQHLGLVLDVVRRCEDVRGFQALPRRWVVERSFAWLLRSRRLVRDYERRTDTSEAVIRWSMISL